MRHIKILFATLIILSLTIPIFVFAQATTTATRSGNVILNATVEPIGYIPEELAPYLGLWGERRVPRIFDVRVFDITSTSATITWQTDILCTTELLYGKTTSYELGKKTDNTGSLWLSHKIVLRGLESDTWYHFKIRAQDSQGTVALSGDYRFKTLAFPDLTPPADVSNFKASPGNGFISLTWKNPVDSDFAGVIILRSQEFYPEATCINKNSIAMNCDDVVLVYDGIGEAYNDVGLINGVRYFYTAFTYDFSGNFSSGAIASAVPAGPIEVVPYIPPYPEVPTELTLRDFRFFVAHDSLELTPDTEGEVKILESSILTTAIEKDKLPPVLKTIILRIGSSGYILKDSNLIPLAIRRQTEPPLTPPLKGGDEREEKSPFFQAGDEGKDKSPPFQGGDERGGFVSLPETIYRVTHQVPEASGIYPLIVLVLIYQDGTKSTIGGKLVVEDYGQIRAEIIEDPTVDVFEKNGNLVIRDAEVGLFQVKSQKSKVKSQSKVNSDTPNVSNDDTPWLAGEYFQFNPQITNENGEYGFMVPNGSYILEVKIRSRQPVKTQEFEVRDNLINHQVVLKILGESFYTRFGIKEFLRFWQDIIWILGLVLLVVIVGGEIIRIFMRKTEKARY